MRKLEFDFKESEREKTTYQRGYSDGYSAARLEAKVLEDALEMYANKRDDGQQWIADDALKKYRGEQE